MKKWLQYQVCLREGDWHIHTSYAHGRDGVYTCCRQAVANGLKLLAFTEHVREKTTYSYDDFLADIARAREEFDIELLAGCEAKVLDLDGTLDVAEDILRQCDVVIGVFHSFRWTDKRSYLTALEAMLRNPLVQIWGHPTLFAHQNGIRLEDEELARIVDICLENNVLIERNLRYMLPEANFIRLAISKGARFVIGSDAHSSGELLTAARLAEEWNYISLAR